MKHRLTAFCLLASILCSAVTAPAAGANSATVRMKLSGASQADAGTSVPGPKGASHYFGQDYQSKMRLQAPPAPRAFYHNIYPGIDLTCYGDEFQLEYVFTVSPGADPSLIKLIFEGIQSVSMTHTGAIRILLPGGEILQNAPLVFIQSGGTQTRAEGRYEMGYGGAVKINPGNDFQDRTAKINGTRFNIVPSGGQPGGPGYDFYLSRYEASNAQLLRFLNDAEANTNTMRGSNMFFDRLGNAWINPRMQRGRDEMFEIAGSRYSYDADKPAGSRYSHWRTKEGKSPYANHPATGVSWFGAVKYCNWLTIEAGRSAADRCYTEGTNTLDWAPVTATNWAKGSFGDAERQAWLSLKGFRLPMLDCRASAITTNNYNEFYKAAAWVASTNRLFAFGRDSFEGNDANYRDTIAVNRPQTFPVGFFDGKRYLGSSLTKPNENFYGIFDLSGNVAEWLNDFGPGGNPATRAVCGGSYDEAPKPLTEGNAVAASSTSTFGGFRTTTTFLPMESLQIHILYSFFMEQDAATRKPPPEGSWTFAPMREAPPTPTESPEQQFATGRSGPSMDVNAPERTSDNITPDGMSYKPGVIEGGEISPIENQPGLIREGNGDEQGNDNQGSTTNTPGGYPVVPPASTNNTLRITSLNPNSGVLIAINPGDAYGTISGSTAFTCKYAPGTLVTLNAPTNTGSYIFQQWLADGALYSTNPVTSVAMIRNITMTAVYVTPPANTNRTLLVTSLNPNSGVLITIAQSDISGLRSGSTAFSRTYSAGTAVTLNAPATVGINIFQQWLQDGAFYSSNRTAGVTMLTNMTMTAVYTSQISTNSTLLVTSQNPNSGVLVTINPGDISGFAAGNTAFSRTYWTGTLVTLNATTNTGSTVFQQWLRDGIFYSANHIATIAMITNMTMTAVYVTPPPNYVLTVRSSSPLTGVPIIVNPPDNNSQANGTTIFTRLYVSGSFVTLTAPPVATGNVFQKWQSDGIDITTNLVTTIFMNTNHTATAVYIYQPGPIDPPPISPGGV